MTIHAWTPLKFLGDYIEKNNILYTRVEFNGRKYEIAENLLSRCEIYYFISSSGVVHSSFEGREPNVDIFRRKSGNYFKNKQDAIQELNNILSKPV